MIEPPYFTFFDIVGTELKRVPAKCVVAPKMCNHCGTVLDGQRTYAVGVWEAAQGPTIESVTFTLMEGMERPLDSKLIGLPCAPAGGDVSIRVELT